MTFKSQYFLRHLLFVLLIAAFYSCKNSNDEEIKASHEKADSLSIQLNSPELKSVNAELLKDPGAANLYEKRARVYLGLRQYNEAINDAKRAIRLDSVQPPYYLTLVDIYYTQNSTRLAKELLEITVKKFPDNTDALLKLSELYFLVRRYQEGIDFANKALRVNENLAKAYFIKGSIYRESGDTGRAISSLETAVEQDKQMTDAYYDLGVLYAARKNPIALDYYDNVLKIDPRHKIARYARAKLLQDLGKTDDAIKEYEEILTYDKSCDNCLYNLGAIFLQLKNDPHKAVDYFTRAIEVNKNYGAAYFARGYSYSLLKDKASARADYNMCLQLEPNNEAAIEGLNALDRP